jgi:hypothetical protein
MRGLVPQALHYEESLPGDSQGLKESDAQLNATLRRLEKLKYQALIKGYIITGYTQAHHEDVQKHFKEKEMIKHPNAPKLKMKDLILTSAIKRMLNIRVKEDNS